MTNQKGENDEIDWEDILLKLHVYTRSLLNSYRWFRVGIVSTRDGDRATYTAGQEASDYVYTAIERYLRNPEKWNSSKGNLVNYLKYNVIKSLIWNDVISMENRTTSEVLVSANDTEEDEDSNYLDRILPFIETNFETEMDFKALIQHVEKEVESDEVACAIFLGKISGSPRREIIAEFSLPEAEYDNGMRRLKTILKNTAIQYKLKKQDYER